MWRELREIRKFVQAKAKYRGSLHCGGKSAAFGRDDVRYCWVCLIERTCGLAMTSGSSRFDSLSPDLFLGVGDSL
jgi:hypothetical protein